MWGVLRVAGASDRQVSRGLAALMFVHLFLRRIPIPGKYFCRVFEMHLLSGSITVHTAPRACAVAAAHRTQIVSVSQVVFGCNVGTCDLVVMQSDAYLDVSRLILICVVNVSYS